MLNNDSFHELLNTLKALVHLVRVFHLKANEHIFLLLDYLLILLLDLLNLRMKLFLKFFCCRIKQQFHIIHNRLRSFFASSGSQFIDLCLVSLKSVKILYGLIDSFETIFEPLQKYVGSVYFALVTQRNFEASLTSISPHHVIQCVFSQNFEDSLHLALLPLHFFPVFKKLVPDKSLHYSVFSIS